MARMGGSRRRAARAQASRDRSIGGMTGCCRLSVAWINIQANRAILQRTPLMVGRASGL